MRILVINNLFPPHYIGGYEIGAREYAEALRSRNHEVLVLTSTYHATGSEEDSDWVRRVLRENEDYDRVLSGDKVFSRVKDFRSHVWDCRNAGVVRRTLSGFAPDLVYAWKCEGLGLAPVAIPLRRDMPVVVHLCDDWLLKCRRYGIKEYLSGAPMKKAIYHFMSGGLRKVILFATSSAVREDCLRAGYPEGNVHVIYYGLADEYWKKAKILEREGPRHRILYVGQLWEGKGVHCLIDAMKILMRRYPDRDFTLDVIGAGLRGYESGLREQVQAHGLSACVRFHGKKPREELWRMYQGYDMLVMPSVWREPQGNTLLEAMANGLPVLVSRVGGLVDVVEHAVSGLMFEPGNAEAIAEAIVNISNNETLARRIAQGAIDINSRKFNLAHIIPEIESIFVRAVHTVRR